MAFYAKNLTRLTPEQYLPRKGNQTAPAIAWSISLNFALWLKVTCEHPQPLSMFIEYEDSRGPQMLPVDSHAQAKAGELLFSNLIKLPIKGPIQHVALVVMYQDEHSEFEVAEMFIRVIEPPSDDPRLSKTA